MLSTVKSVATTPLKMGKTSFFKNCREDYGSEFMANVDHSCLLIDNYKKLEDVSTSFLKEYTGKNTKWDSAAKAAEKYGREEYTGKNTKWDSAAKAAEKYGREIRTRKECSSFESGAKLMEKIGVAQAESAATIMEVFNKKLHGFVQLEVKEMLDHLKQLESLRKEMDKTAKKASKNEDEITKNNAVQAKETHDRYVPRVAESMKKFIESAEMLKDACNGWIEAEKTLCKKTKEIIEEFKG